MWSYAHGNLFMMENKSDVLFTVNRSDHFTGKGATSALTKEFVKMLARYYGVSNDGLRTTPHLPLLSTFRPPIDARTATLGPRRRRAQNSPGTIKTRESAQDIV